MAYKKSTIIGDVENLLLASTPSVWPRPNHQKLYFKADGFLYKLDELGNESVISEFTTAADIPSTTLGYANVQLQLDSIPRAAVDLTTTNISYTDVQDHLDSIPRAAADLTTTTIGYSDVQAELSSIPRLAADLDTIITGETVQDQLTMLNDELANVVRKNYIKNPYGETNSSFWNVYNDRVTVSAIATTTATADTVDAVAHGLSNGTQVCFLGASDGFDDATKYYVINKTDDTFQIALTEGGTLIDLTADLTGVTIYNISVANGTGGSAGVTFDNTEITTPLEGLKSFEFTVPATALTNYAGEGFSTDFDIMYADAGSSIYLSFDYYIKTGSVQANELQVYVYDKTNAVIIHPEVTLMDAQSSSSPSSFTTRFASNASSTSYRLIVHNTKCALNESFVMVLDNFYVETREIKTGVPVTEWVSYTPEVLNVTTTSIQGMWRRVGDNLECQGAITFDVAPSWVIIIGLPNDYVISDYCEGFSVGVNGAGAYTVSSRAIGKVMGAGSTGVVDNTYVAFYTLAGDSMTGAGSATGTLFWEIQHPYVWTAGSTVSWSFSARIVGWGSNVQMSTIDGVRPVMTTIAMSTTSIANEVSTAATSASSIVKDSHGAFNETTGEFTVPVSGDYKVTGVVNFASESTGTRAIELFVDGSQITSGFNLPAFTTDFGTPHYPFLLNIPSLRAGQVIKLMLYQNSGGPLNASAYYSFDKLSSPQNMFLDGVSSSKQGVIKAKGFEYSNAPVTLSNPSAGVLDMDCNLSDTFTYDLTAVNSDITLTISNARRGSFVAEVIHYVGADHTLTFPNAYFIGENGLVTKVFTLVDSRRTLFNFYYNDTNWYISNAGF